MMDVNTLVLIIRQVFRATLKLLERYFQLRTCDDEVEIVVARASSIR